MTPSPAEFVKSLAPAEQDAVLESLLEAVFARWGGGGLVTIRSPKGKGIGYLVPPHGTPSLIEMIERMPDEIREKMLGPLPDDLDLDDCLTEKELEELRQEAFARAERSVPSGATPAESQPALV